MLSSTLTTIRHCQFGCLLIALLILLVQPIRTASAQPTDDPYPRFKAHVYHDKDGNSLPYRLAKPEKPDGPMPLILFLHGAGERGDDNQRQLTWGHDLLLKAVNEYNCMVLVPQCPAEQWWCIVDRSKPELTFADKPSEPMRLAQAVVDQLIEQNDIDTDRLYVMGLSMGGFGTWDAICRWPDRFAAAVPICGWGDPNVADRIHTPVWAFHGGADPVVPVDYTRAMVKAIHQHDGEAKYTEYPGVGHNSWSSAFAEKDLLPWIMSKKLPKQDKQPDHDKRSD